MRNRLIPAYTYAASLQARLEAEALLPGDIVVLNPNSGPTGSTVTEREAIIKAIAYIRIKGAFPFGYVALGYGSRDVGNVIVESALYNTVFKIENIFFDETPSRWGSSELNRLNSMVSTISSRSPFRSVFNMGTRSLGVFKSPPKTSLVITHEGNSLPLFIPRPWEAALVYSSKECSVDTVGVYEALTELGWAYGYATEDVLENPWDGIPS